MKKIKKQKYIKWFKDIRYGDVALVGGKNASLGEMFSKLTKKGINVPDGFAVTASAYWHFAEKNKLTEKLKEIFENFKPQEIKSLQTAGALSRQLFSEADFPDDLKKEIIRAYRKLSEKYRQGNVDVAVRSSGVCEDQPETSFAGQFESFLNVCGEENLLTAAKKCFASAFNDRIISYREEGKIPHLKFALSVGVQKMVRSDSASSGVMFTLDTETGFPNVVLINSILGIGELIVKGKITPDEFYVFKPTLKQGYRPIIIKSLGRKTRKLIYGKRGGLKETAVPRQKQLKFSLTDNEVLALAEWACQIEEHYKVPQDIEWAKDGRTGRLFIIQARPETIHSRKESTVFEEYRISAAADPILTGIAIGEKIGRGRVRVVTDVAKISQFLKGEILVTKMTNPDWVPALRLASGVITDEGGRTCHAAIVSRELGVPAVVGVQKATKILKTGQKATIDCSQGLQGRIFNGEIPFKIKKHNLEKIPKLKTKIMLNIGMPDMAFKSSFLPNEGVGLARIEFILAERLKVHPLALYYYGELKTLNRKSRIPNKSQMSKSKIEKTIKQIEQITIEYEDKREYFIKELTEGIAQIAAAFWPKPVIVRFSDFKTNEYRNLIAGELFESGESNPMLGFRGASRYLDKDFQPAFQMECRAIKRARDEFGLKNVSVMIPFCRTVEEGRAVLKIMHNFGLRRDEAGTRRGQSLKVYVMCEIPSNVILAEEFLEIFDGMSIGSNDLTQLSLGIDRDNAKIAHIADERSEAVKEMIGRVVRVCRKKRKYCGICGQAPSDYFDFAEFLMKQGIESMSLNPDTVIKTILNLAKSGVK